MHMATAAFAQHHTELRVYQNAFQAACTVQRVTASFPDNERYSLTEQVRRSSRSVCANIAEAWRKRQYPNHFASKLSDADAECAETQTWLEFAKEFGYLDPDRYASLCEAYRHIGKQLGIMLAQRESWALRR